MYGDGDSSRTKRHEYPKLPKPLQPKQQEKITLQKLLDRFGHLTELLFAEGVACAPLSVAQPS
jgi:hypothetical protein